MCLWTEGISAKILTGEYGIPVNGGDELGRRFFNQNVQKRESQIRLFYKGKAKRRVKRIEAV